MNMENNSGVTSKEEKSWFVHQSSQPILPADSSSSEKDKRAKEMMNLALRSTFVHTSQVISYMQ
jgi:hypothetical protein